MLESIKEAALAMVAMGIIVSLGLIFIVSDVKAKEPEFQQPFNFHGFRVALEKGLDNWCIPEGTDECFERGARCGRTENIVVCLKYRKT